LYLIQVIYILYTLLLVNVGYYYALSKLLVIIFMIVTIMVSKSIASLFDLREMSLPSFCCEKRSV